MRIASIFLLLVVASGCAASSKYQRELDQEEAVLRAWDRAAKEQAGDE